MGNKSASRILDDRIDGRLDLQEAIRRQTANLELAQCGYGLRKAANLSQKALAQLIGTSQPAIARFESADSGSSSFAMMNRIADALGYRVSVEVMRVQEANAEPHAGAVVGGLASTMQDLLPSTPECLHSTEVSANNNYAYAA